MTAIKKSFKALFERARQTLTYAVEGVILEFTEGIVARMESENVSKAELAKRLEASPAYVTKVLRGNSNFTLETMVKIARALNAEVRVHLQPVGSKTQWLDESQTARQTGAEQCVMASLPKEHPHAVQQAVKSTANVNAAKEDRKAANEELALAA